MVRIRWGGERSLQERRLAVQDSLAASGQLPLQTYDLSQGSIGRQRFYAAMNDAGLTEVVADAWPTEASLGDVPGLLFRDNDEAVLRLKDGSVAYVHVDGWASVRVASATRDAAAFACAAFRGLWAPAYMAIDPDGRVPITFWTLGRFGAEARLRKIETAAWAEIEGNYPAAIREELNGVMDWFDGPGADGQLLLWHGPPGTGKSWVLRALATQWAPWAEFSYITDPDAFFVTDPSYMIEVLLADSYATMEIETGDTYLEQRPDSKWRVLICEDTGELLSADAKDRVGQGLSRLLNVVDGMIGQGLRVLAIITTNDEIAAMHPAVIRPGRCASILEFGALSPEEATAFLGEATEEGGTLAELYARRKTAEASAFPEEVTPLNAAGDVDATIEAVLELARQPLPELEPGDRERYRHRPLG